MIACIKFPPGNHVKVLNFLHLMYPGIIQATSANRLTVYNPQAELFFWSHDGDVVVVVLVFYGPSTFFRSFRAQSVNLSTLFLGKPPRQFTSTGQSLYNAMFGIHRTGPCYKWTMLYKDTFINYRKITIWEPRPGHVLTKTIKGLSVLSAHSFASNWQLPFLNQRQRMAVEIISWPNSTKECCRTPGSNLRPSTYQAEADPCQWLHVDCGVIHEATWDDKNHIMIVKNLFMRIRSQPVQSDQHSLSLTWSQKDVFLWWGSIYECPVDSLSDRSISDLFLNRNSRDDWSEAVFCDVWSRLALKNLNIRTPEKFTMSLSTLASSYNVSAAATSIIIEPAHENVVLFFLCELILQTCMCSHPVGLDVWFLVGPFVYFHTSCVRKLWQDCSSEPSLVAYVVSTIISWDGSYSSWWWRHKVSS